MVFFDNYTVFRFKIYHVANRSKGKSTQSEGSFLESIRPSDGSIWSFNWKKTVYWLNVNGLFRRVYDLLTESIRSFKFTFLFKSAIFKRKVDGLSTETARSFELQFWTKQVYSQVCGPYTFRFEWDTIGFDRILLKAIILQTNLIPGKHGENLENIPGSNKFMREFDSHGKKFTNFWSDLVMLSGWEIHSINIE